MKCINYCVFVCALLLGAQGALANGSAEVVASRSPDVDMTSVLVDRKGAAIRGEREQTIPEYLGLAGHGPFPSRGGPIDD